LKNLLRKPGEKENINYDEHEFDWSWNFSKENGKNGGVL
jgi:hypothetical protein